MRSSECIRFVSFTLFVAAASFHAFGQTGQAPVHVFFRVQAAASVGAPVSGRLLIFLKEGSGDKEVSLSEFHPEGTWVAAREIHDLAPGSAIEFDADEISYPKPFSSLAPGNYEAQAVLDVDHTYNYQERVPEDWISNVVQLSSWTPGSGAEPLITLDHHPEENPRMTAMMAAAKAQAKPGVAQLEEFQSPLLSRFWGHPMSIRAWVILPPGYDEQTSDKYPTAYWTHGFGGAINGALFSGLQLRSRMAD